MINKEIQWNIVNSLLAGGLVFLGSFATGGVTKEGLLVASITAAVVAVSKFQDYWKKEEQEYSHKLSLFHFVG